MTTATRKPLTVKHIPILVSSRIRLSNEERSEILTSYKYAKEDNEAELTQYDLSDLLGMSEPIFYDIVNRDSIPVHMLVSIQKALGIEVVDKQRMIDACLSYINHIFKSNISKGVK